MSKLRSDLLKEWYTLLGVCVAALANAVLEEKCLL